MCHAAECARVSTASDPGNESKSESESSVENDMIIRAKWSIDGARTLDEAVEKLGRFAEYLKSLKASGFDLRAPIDDDYGYVHRVAPAEQATPPETQRDVA